MKLEAIEDLREMWTAALSDWDVDVQIDVVSGKEVEVAFTLWRTKVALTLYADGEGWSVESGLPFSYRDAETDIWKIIASYFRNRMPDRL